MSQLTSLGLAAFICRMQGFSKGSLSSFLAWGSDARLGSPDEQILSFLVLVVQMSTIN